MKFRIGMVFIGALVVALVMGASTTSASTSQSKQDRARQDRAEQDRARDFMYQPATGLVAAVREATARYRDVTQAAADGYVPVLGCVSSPDEGAMGAHYLKPDLLGDGVEDVAHPELLVYEPSVHGRMRLVAVEYLTIADTWDSGHSDGSPPILMGQLFNHANTPNRFRLPANYSLHVWAWKYNPNGVFSMWNPRVSCTAFAAS